MSDLVELLGNMRQPMTVQELISKLAGLPPMMDVFINADNVDMFLNNVRVIEGTDIRSPFVLLDASTLPRHKEEDDSSYEELLDKQRQRAMAMGEASERESKMPKMVD